MESHVKELAKRRWAPLTSAALLLLAFPPFNIWPLVFVALVPLFLKLRTADSKEAWRLGFWFGSLYFLGQLFWLFNLADRWTHSPWLAFIPWVLGSAYCAATCGWISVLIRICFARNWHWLVPFAWAGFEVARSYIPVLAFPWGLAGLPLYRAPELIQSAHYGTIFFVSGWVVLMNVILAAAFTKEDRPRLKPLVIGFLTVLALSIIRFELPYPGSPYPITVAQPGVDMAFGNPATARAEIAANVDGISAAAIASGSKLLVLPEGIVGGKTYPPKPEFTVDKRLPVLFGGQRGFGPTYQTAYSFDGRWHYADKTRLVIFGEFVPGRSTFPFITKAFRLATEDIDASKNGVQSVLVGGFRAGPMLCFEGLFPDVSYDQARNGSQLIAVMCIDDWYMGTPAPEQLMASSIFRAVETGLPLVRSGSLGYTIAVDAHGRIVGRLPLKAPAGLRVDLAIPVKPPLFTLLPVFPYAALVFAVALPWLPYRRSRDDDNVDRKPV